MQDGHISKEYANKSSRLHQEIKGLQKKLKEEEELSTTISETDEKKRILIIEMEEAILRNGYSKMELVNIRKKFDTN